MPQTAAESTVLTYATGVKAGLTNRGWSVLFWVGVFHLLAVLLLAAASVPDFLRLWEFLRTGSLSHWFPIGLIISNAAIPVMAPSNGLAVAGFGTALRGRSPARWFLIYVPTQIALMALMLGITVALVVHGQYQVSPSSSVGKGTVAIPTTVVAFAVVNLPLVLMLFPKIRRACLAG